MTNNLGADLISFSSNRHRPVAYVFWQSSLTEEIPKVVREDKELQPDMIVAES